MERWCKVIGERVLCDTLVVTDTLSTGGNVVVNCRNDRDTEVSGSIASDLQVVANEMEATKIFARRIDIPFSMYDGIELRVHSEKLYDFFVVEGTTPLRKIKALPYLLLAAVDVASRGSVKLEVKPAGGRRIYIDVHVDRGIFKRTSGTIELRNENPIDVTMEVAISVIPIV